MQRRSTSILSRLLTASLAVVLAVSVLPVTSAHAAGARRYARPLGLTSGACDSWANACELYYALQVSSSNGGGEVWARGGVHIPNASSQSNSLVVGEGTRLYGGFAGDETSLSQRKPSVNVTILSGDIDFDGTPTGNSYHVVTLTGDSSATLVDGFTITQGYAIGGGAGELQGGGMQIGGGAPGIRNVSFVNNYAGLAGGGLHVTGGATPALASVSFVGNHSANGGGMSVVGSSPSLSNVSFSGNLASVGGGMYVVSNSSAVMNNVTFSGNTALGSAGNGGGGMYIDSSSPHLTNVTFTGNGSLYGGGLFNNTGSPILSKVRFNGNSATSIGGGMINTGSNGPMTLTDVSFNANEARSGAGGGLYNSGLAGTMTLKNVTFAGNSSPDKGAGLYNYSSTLALTNVTFSGNSSPGSGFYNNSSSVSLKFVTASGNIGGAMFNQNSSTVTISNSIFWNDSGGEISNTLDTTISFSHGILQGGCASATFTTCSAVNKNPKLKALRNNGGFTKTMALASTSPAIDKVSCAGVKADQRGVKRPQGLKCDMGAYEFVP